jgi:hypothetical protein
MLARVKGWSAEVDPVYTATGRRVHALDYGDAALFSPFAFSTYHKGDLNQQELAELAANSKSGFGPPSPFLAGSRVDLRQIPATDGTKHSMFAQYQELVSTVQLKGKTIEQEIRHLITSRDYINEATPPTATQPGSREMLMREVIAKYREAATKTLMATHPDLQQAWATDRCNYANSMKQQGQNVTCPISKALAIPAPVGPPPDLTSATKFNLNYLGTPIR